MTQTGQKQTHRTLCCNQYVDGHISARAYGTLLVKRWKIACSCYKKLSRENRNQSVFSYKWQQPDASNWLRSSNLQHCSTWYPDRFNIAIARIASSPLMKLMWSTRSDMALNKPPKMEIQSVANSRFAQLVCAVSNFLPWKISKAPHGQGHEDVTDLHRITPMVALTSSYGQPVHVGSSCHHFASEAHI